MLKLLKLFVLLFFVSSVVLSETKYSYKGDSFLLKTSEEEITTYRRKEYLTRYSVYRNNNFLHPVGYGGRFFSCSKDKTRVIPITSLKGQIGWVLVGGGICGNTFSFNCEVIIPEQEKKQFQYKKFISKELPKIKPNENGANIVFYQQEWGRGGTAYSFFVPHVLEIQLNNFEKIIKGSVLEHIKLFDSPNPKWLSLNFLGLFTSGLNDLDPKLMSYALESYYDKTQLDWYKIHFDDPSSESFKKMIALTTKFQKFNTENRNIFNWSN